MCQSRRNVRDMVLKRVEKALARGSKRKAKQITGRWGQDRCRSDNQVFLFRDRIELIARLGRAYGFVPVWRGLNGPKRGNFLEDSIFVMRITGELALRPYLPVIKKETNSCSGQQRHHGRRAKMFTFTALKSVVMAIAAQASLTVTIPNDTQITRELDRVEVIRQLEPIEPKIQMAQAKSIS